ncbi:MAG: SDR family oxidoreductase [Myxococcales bacterium]|nr:SDR family oxidoreductase [Myxococcales bacterium]
MSEWTVAGKVCLVTGANTGIGQVTAHDLARRGAHVFLACRSEAKTRPVIDAIKADTGNEKVEFLPLDLGDLDSVRACVEQFKARRLPLHVLVANAGLAGQKGLTKSGFELAFGVNHVGHALFIRLLVDTLKASTPSRIVIVASRAHTRVKRWDLGGIQKPTKTLTGFPEYCTSKLANVYFARALARRLEGSGVNVYSLHPGVVASDIWRKVPQPFRWLMTRSMVTVEEGAQTQIHCATAPECSDQHGLYYVDSAPFRVAKLAEDDGNGEALWNDTADWIGLPQAL